MAAAGLATFEFSFALNCTTDLDVTQVRVHERALTHKTPRGGFEPPTTRLEGACSIQLSYRGSW